MQKTRFTQEIYIEEINTIFESENRKGDNRDVRYRKQIGILV